MKLAIARRLEQSPDTVTSMTQPDVGPVEVGKRCGMLSHLCGVCHLTPWAPDEMADGIQWTV